MSCLEWLQVRQMWVLGNLLTELKAGMFLGSAGKNDSELEILLYVIIYEKSRASKILLERKLL